MHAYTHLCHIIKVKGKEDGVLFVELQMLNAQEEYHIPKHQTQEQIAN